MKEKITVAMLFALITAPYAKDKLKARFRPLFAKFGESSATKIRIVSGPRDVKMRNGRVPGKCWSAVSGDHRFKLTIQEGTGVKLEQLVKRLEKLPPIYMRACTAVSDPTEDGIAVYASLGGARAHGGKSYINLVPHADALVIAHEAGHTLEQVARQANMDILEMWKSAVEADKISVSDYGDHANHEDIAEFAQVYAVCLGGGADHLAALKKLSPARYALWDRILRTEYKQEMTLDLGGGVTMAFVLVPAGTYMMGGRKKVEEVMEAFQLSEAFKEYLGNEYPRHRVRITHSFYLGKHEVTQAQWRAVMGTQPSFCKSDAHPVESVSWQDCRAFMEKLNRRFGREGVTFGLPTEAQWEHACRAGTSTWFSFGDDQALLDAHAWYGRNSGKKLQPVGRKKPNPWGLHDMLGNVTEWCEDRYDADYYKNSPEVDPPGPSKGASRVLRGGSFYDDTPDYFRSSDRYHDHPEYRYYRYGFRVAAAIAPFMK